MNIVRRLGSCLLVLATLPVAAQTTGPSSSAPPYMVPIEPQSGVRLTSILTVGDAAAEVPYRLVGVPDGLGAMDNGDGTFTLLVNHELAGHVGVVRAHGSRGAFVSRWTIRKRDLTVLRGEDLAQRLMLWDPDGGYTESTTALAALCSADLAAGSAFFDQASGRGTRERLYLTGEERSDRQGRGGGSAFAFVVTGDETGIAYELPWMGKYAFENVVANPGTGARTVVIGLDDAYNDRDVAESYGEMYVYAGDKRDSGSVVVRAGLAGGTLFALAVQGMPVEPRGPTRGREWRFASVEVPDGERMDDQQIEDFARLPSNGVTAFRRPEDGAWDPERPSDFYFVTTDLYDVIHKDPNPTPNLQGRVPPPGQQGFTRLWRLRFDDPSRPEGGGSIGLLIDGRRGRGRARDYQMFDNLCIGRGQRLLIQEDTGNTGHLARIWEYRLPTEDTEGRASLKRLLRPIAEATPALFGPGPNGAYPQTVLTTNEESSGVIDVSEILGPGHFLLSFQAHYPVDDEELVQGGQLLLLQLPD